MAIEMSVGIRVSCSICGLHLPVNEDITGKRWTQHPIRPFDCTNNDKVWDIPNFTDLPNGYESIKQRID